jgi:hypothetical protein
MIHLDTPDDLTPEEAARIQERLDTMREWGSDLTMSEIMQEIARAGGCEHDPTSHPMAPRFVRPDAEEVKR